MMVINYWFSLALLHCSTLLQLGSPILQCPMKNQASFLLPIYSLVHRSIMCFIIWKHILFVKQLKMIRSKNRKLYCLVVVFFIVSLSFFPGGRCMMIILKLLLKNITSKYSCHSGIISKLWSLFSWEIGA